jgi:hypothetical protein
MSLSETECGLSMWSSRTFCKPEMTEQNRSSTYEGEAHRRKLRNPAKG